jgi:hypothetical protein
LEGFACEYERKKKAGGELFDILNFEEEGEVVEEEEIRREKENELFIRIQLVKKEIRKEERRR